ncbi:MAG: PEGA domain-containing protein [Polyangiales bacterium]
MKCSHCGSPLRVEAAKAFAECEYCGKSTRVRSAKTLMAEQPRKPAPAPTPAPQRASSRPTTSRSPRRGESSGPVTAGGCVVIVTVMIALGAAVLPLMLTSGFRFPSLSELPFFQDNRPPAPLFILLDSESHRLDGVADGNEEAMGIASSMCEGYLQTGPDLRIQTPNPGVVHLDVEGAGDLTLAVHLSDGRWLCDDDSGAALLPRIVESFPAGEHQIYVGRFSTSAPEPFVLLVSEDMPHLPRPEASLEDKPEDTPPRRRRRRRRRSTAMPATPMSDEPPAEMAPPPVVGALPLTPMAEPTHEGAHEGTRGMLSVHTTPWSTVRIDGRIVGNTPRTNLIVTAGTVQVEVQREGHGPWETLRVQVSPGETATLNHTF